MVSQRARAWLQRAGWELRSTRLPSRILIGLLCVVLFIIGGALLQTISAERRVRAQVELTTEALSLLRRSLLAATDAETGHRGFLLTRHPEFLQPYGRGAAIWLPTLAELREVLRAESPPREDAVVAQLEEIAAERLAWLERSVALGRSGAWDDAAAEVATATGKRLMDEYRAVVGEVEAEQSALQREALARARLVEARAVPIIFLLGASIFGLVFTVVGLERAAARAEAVANEAIELRQANTRAELLARELNHRVKNLFAVILSIVTLAAREEVEPKHLISNIRSRIYALSLAHGVSQGHSDTEFVLTDLVSAILKPYDDEKGRVRLSGPKLRLPVKAVTPLGLSYPRAGDKRRKVRFFLQ